MKSTSGNDGSYNLTVSFALGSDPDIDTVNVNNRVQTAMAQLPHEVQLQGLTVLKRSAAILRFLVALQRRRPSSTPIFITSYATINVLDELSRVPGVGQALLFGRLNYSMRIWFDTERLTSLNLSPSDVVNAIQAQNVQAPVGRDRRAPGEQRPAVPDERADAGAADDAGAVRRHRAARQSRRLGAARAGRRAGRDGRAERGHRDAASTAAPRVGIALYLSPDANAVQTATLVDRGDGSGCSSAFRRGLKAQIVYDSTLFVADTIHEVLKTLGRSLRPRRHRRLPVPRQSARHDHPGGGRAGQPDRHFRRAAGDGLFGQYGVAAGDGARDRHRRRRRDRRRRERRARARGGAAISRRPRRRSRRCAQITGPIIAITLVLLSVFVPVAFIPGISGQLFRQFAVTISVAMLISALNALTLSPALCALVLRHGRSARGPMAMVLRRHRRGARRLCRGGAAPGARRRPVARR